MPSCLICGVGFELAERVFPDSLKEDKDFYPKCFKEIMNSDAGELDDYLNDLLAVTE